MHRALVEVQAIPTCAATQKSKNSGKETVSDDFRTCKWGRAARTDKGVSAAGQVVAFDMALRADMAARLNAVLPDQILVYGFKCAPSSQYHPSRDLCLPGPQWCLRLPHGYVTTINLCIAHMGSCRVLQAGGGAV